MARISNAEVTVGGFCRSISQMAVANQLFYDGDELGQNETNRDPLLEKNKINVGEFGASEKFFFSLESSDSNTIFFAPKDSSSGKIELDSSTYQNTIDLINKWSPVFELLKKANSVHSCEELAKSLEVTSEILNAFLRALNVFWQLRERKLVRDTAGEVKNAASRINNSSVVEVGSFQEVLDFLRGLNGALSHKLNVVILWHGTKDGFLVDSNHSFVPPSFFAELEENNSIVSMAIYSCYPLNVQARYKPRFEALVGRKTRLFFPLGQGTLKRNQLMPLNSFGSFIENLKAFGAFEH